jgi:hypothetical protein
MVSHAAQFERQQRHNTKTADTSMRSSMRAAGSRMSTATPLEFDRPQARTRPLPLVQNRADPDQVDEFYKELSDAIDTGQRKFEEGINDRAQQRVDAKGRQSRVMVVGDEVLEPLTHVEFLQSVNKFIIGLSEVADGYDSDEAEADRMQLYERTRRMWHFEKVRSAVTHKPPSQSTQHSGHLYHPRHHQFHTPAHEHGHQRHHQDKLSQPHHGVCVFVYVSTMRANH